MVIVPLLDYDGEASIAREQLLRPSVTYRDINVDDLISQPARLDSARLGSARPGECTP